MVQDVWFYVNSIILVALLSFLIPFFLKKYSWVMPAATLIIMTLSGFIMPNFYDHLNWQPLIGYAMFLTVLSIFVTLGTMVYRRNRNKQKRGRATRETSLNNDNNKRRNR